MAMIVRGTFPQVGLNSMLKLLLKPLRTVRVQHLFSPPSRQFAMQVLVPTKNGDR